MTKSRLRIVMLISVITTAVLGVTPDVQAECSGGLCTGRVDRLYTHSSGGVVYVGTNGTETALTCTPVQGSYLTLRPSQPLFTQLYDSLLKAVTFGKPVIIRLPTTPGPCNIIYVVVERGSTISGIAKEGLLEDEEP